MNHESQSVGIESDEEVSLRETALNRYVDRVDKKQRKITRG